MSASTHVQEILRIPPESGSRAVGIKPARWYATSEALLQRPVLALRCNTSRVTRTMPLIRCFHSVLATVRAALNTPTVLVSRRLRAFVMDVSLPVGWRQAY